MITFIRILKNLFSPSKRRNITKRILEILKAYPEGLSAPDIWDKLEDQVNDCNDPNYVPLAYVYDILTRLQYRGVIRYASKKENSTWYWKLS